MSGGSLDYAYSKVNYIADEVERQATTALQKAFVKHLRDVSEALHDLEWCGVVTMVLVMKWRYCVKW